MVQINTNDPIDLGKLISAIRKCIRKLTGHALEDGKIDAYEEIPYDEEKQKYVIELSFNEGDMRTMEITLDIEPDTSWQCPICETIFYNENIPEIGQPCPVCETIRTE